MLTRRQRDVFTDIRKNYGFAYNEGRTGKPGSFGGYTGSGHFENHNRWRQSANTIKRYFSPRTALDIGCGRGSLVDELRNAGVFTWGVDIGEDIRTPWGAVANACELPFSGRFDTVIALDLIEHIPWDFQEELFSELRRVTGWLLIVTVPTEDPHYKVTSAVPARNHYLCLPSDEWARLFERESFDVVSCGEELSALGMPFCFGETNYPFVLSKR